MSRRHLSRSIVLQSLYEWDFSDKKKDLVRIVNHNIEEFGPGLEDEHIQFMWRLVHGIATHLKEIDETIVKMAPEWPLGKIAIIDRNVLRIGLFELLFADADEVPPKVSINEAIELAKNYGGPNASRFVNGVMGSVYREKDGKGGVGRSEAAPPREKKEHSA